jgi:hypothetical protein
MLFLEMPLQDARPAPGLRTDVRWWLSNEWAVPTRLRRGDREIRVEQDAQADVLQLSATVPWARVGGPQGWQTTAELRLLERWGGWTDGIISGWHHLIGSTNFSRSLYPGYHAALRLEETGGRPLLALQHPGLTVSDLALRTQGTLIQEERGALAMRADVKLPTGRLSAVGGSGAVDAGFGLAATLTPRRWLTVHGMTELRLVSPLPRGFPLQPAPAQWGIDASAVVRLSEHLALILEDRLSSPLFRGGLSLLPAEPDPQSTAYYGLFRPYNQISGGVRFSETTIYFSEDFTPGRRLAADGGPQWFYNSNAPDIVLGVCWTRVR